MRRLLSFVFIFALLCSLGCKEEKVVKPKDVPPPPKGPPTGAKAGDGSGDKSKADKAKASPPLTP